MPCFKWNKLSAFRTFKTRYDLKFRSFYESDNSFPIHDRIACMTRRSDCLVDHDCSFRRLTYNENPRRYCTPKGERREAPVRLYRMPYVSRPSPAACESPRRAQLAEGSAGINGIFGLAVLDYDTRRKPKAILHNEEGWEPRRIPAPERVARMGSLQCRAPERISELCKREE